MTAWSLPTAYLVWHYSAGLRDLWSLIRNLFWFLYHFFSVPVLLRTLLAPWRRLGETYPRGFDLGAVFSTFLINTLMRLVGLLLRLGLLACAVLTLGLSFLLAILVFIFWLIAPILVIMFLVLGIKLLL